LESTAQDASGVDVGFDSKVVTVPNSRAKPQEIVRSVPDLLTTARVNNGLKVRELVYDLKR